jgi:predicted TIM-barrel fold metal-dependent hydrolase
MGDLLLRDFMPRSTLVTEEHFVERPKFPVIDAHNHLGFHTDAFGQPVLGEDLWRLGNTDTLVSTMDECSIRAIANLTGRWGDDLKRLVEQFEGRYPSRFYTFANVDWSRVNEPGFGERAAMQLGESVKAGARGLKIFKNLGLRVKDASGRLLSPDDERLDPLWAKAGELGVPVLIHVADPVAFFQPLDRWNPAYMSLQRRPQWHFYGAGIPSFQELIEAGIQVMARHPQTTFITAHTGWYSENLKFVGEQMLDRLPNMYTDFSARISTLGRQPYSAREFFMRYQDRIIFGTDMGPSPQMYRTFFRFLETADEYFEASPGNPRRRIYGVYLPDGVLEKIYHKNVEKVVPGLG